MLTVCWAVKGGSGTSTVTALLALSAHRPTTLVDLDGDLPLILGVAPSGRPGIAEWAASGTPTDHLDDLVVDVAPDVTLLPARASAAPNGKPLPGDRLSALLRWCTARCASGLDVFVDAGTGALDAALHDAADRTLLVTRNCYLALQRAASIGRPPSTVILICESALGLGRAEAESAIGAPVGAVMAVEPGIARTVNAGLLTTRARRLSVDDDHHRRRRWGLGAFVAPPTGAAGARPIRAGNDHDAPGGDRAGDAA